MVFGHSNSIILFLLSRNAHVNAPDDHHLTPLHHAAVRGNVIAMEHLLTSPDINIECQTDDEVTALHLAASHGNLDVVRQLIDAGAELMCPDGHRSTALHRAAITGNLHIVKLLLETTEHREGGAGVAQMLAEKSVDQSTPLHLASENGHHEVVEYLTSRGANTNTPRSSLIYPLHLAAVAGNFQTVQKLLEKTENVDCVNSKSETPLHLAAEFNHFHIIDCLVQHGSNIESRNRDNATPLLKAASHGHVEAFEHLIALGADLRATDKDQKCAAHLAAENNKVDVLTVILQHPLGTELMAYSDCFRNTPLHLAAYKGHIQVVAFLLDSGAEIAAKNVDEQTPLLLASMKGHYRVVDSICHHDVRTILCEDQKGNTPLHLAALSGHTSVVQQLLGFGAKSNLRNTESRTALDYAAMQGHTEVVRILLKAGCPVEMQEGKQATPLHLAATKGNVEIVKLLLQNGADVSRKDSTGMNCLQLAIADSQHDVAKTIVESDHWLKALESESFDAWGLNHTPLRMLIRKMPDVAETVLDRCTKTNNLPPEHVNYRVEFLYHLLDDTYFSFGDIKASGSRATTRVRDKENFRNKMDGLELRNNHPLFMMVSLGRDRLIAHPLCLAYLRLKWNSFGFYLFHIYFFFQVLFVTFVTGYILMTPKPVTGDSVVYSDEADENNTGYAPGTTIDSCPYSTADEESIAESVFLNVGRTIVLTLVNFHVLKEIFHCYMYRLNYFRINIVLPWFCNILALLLVMNFTDCSYITGVREVWQWNIAAFEIFLTWMNFGLFIGRSPTFGLYSVMFINVLSTVINLFPVFFIVIMAFALGFHTTLYYEVPWSGFGRSIIRTIVFMLGEIDFDDNYQDSEMVYWVTSYIFLVLCMTFCNLLIIKFLVSLAVNDIKRIQCKVKIERAIMLTNMVLSFESVLPQKFQRRFILHKGSISPNLLPKAEYFQRFLVQINNSRPLKEALIATTKTDPEKVQEHQQNLLKHNQILEDVLGRLGQQTMTMQAMTSKLMSFHGLKYNDDDDSCEQTEKTFTKYVAKIPKG